MGPTRPETSVNNYHTTPRNISEERRCHQLRGGGLKSQHLWELKKMSGVVQKYAALSSVDFSLAVSAAVYLQCIA
jgi:hypothetical protein